MQTDSLYDLQPGDVVMVCSPSFQKIATVDRVTETLVIVGIDRYRKSDGSKQNHTAGVLYIKPMPPEVLAEFKAQSYHQELVDKIQAIDWKSLSDTKLQIIFNIATQL